MIQWNKVSNNEVVISLIQLREEIEKKIQKLDKSALINYEIEKLNETDESQLPQQEISDEEIFKQSIKEMEEWYGSDCKEEIDAHFRGAKWMQKWYREQLKTK